MKILHISDTHGLHKQLGYMPEADIIVHSGDFTMGGTEQEVKDFLNWFLDLPYKEKVLVAGNHDDCLFGADIVGLDANCHYLCNSGAVVGGIHFYGIPLFMEMAITDCLERAERDIPEDTDILVTHQPPAGILDYSDSTHYGSPTLLKRIREVRPSYHLFGHIHGAYGHVSAYGTHFSNASLVDENYSITQRPVLIDY